MSEDASSSSAARAGREETSGSGLVDDVDQAGDHDGRNQRDRRGSPTGGGSDVGAIRRSQA
jgi:hypothetical protein